MVSLLKARPWCSRSDIVKTPSIIFTPPGYFADPTSDIMHHDADAVRYDARKGRTIYQGRQQYSRDPPREKRRQASRRHEDVGHTNPGYRQSLQPYDMGPDNRDYYDNGAQQYYDNGDTIGTKLIGFTFLVLGFLLMTLGVLEVLFCLEHAYYSRFWTATVVIFFAIFILVHGGNYKSPWKNIMVLVYGILATVCVHTTVAMVTKTLSIEVILAAQMDTSSLFENAWHLLSFNIAETPIVDSSTRTQPWLCLSFDVATIGVLMLLFLCVAATCVMADRFWREMYEYSEDDKFSICSPCMFNPYGQLSAAQALSFVGMVCIYGCLSGLTKWNDYWIPVWSAGIIGTAAIVNIVALKMNDLLHVSGMAMVLQAAAVVASIATIVLSIMGLVDVIKLLDEPAYSTGFIRRRAIASACLLACQTFMACLNAFYSIGLTVRLFDNLYMSSLPMEKPQETFGDGGRKYKQERY